MWVCEKRVMVRSTGRNYSRHASQIHPTKKTGHKEHRLMVPFDLSSRKHRPIYMERKLISRGWGLGRKRLQTAKGHKQTNDGR